LMSLSESVALLYLVHERGGDTPIVVVTAKPVNCELSGGSRRQLSKHQSRKRLVKS